MANTFNHVGIGVGNIQRAVNFYRDAFGCRLLGEVFEVTSDGPNGEEAVDVLSSRPFRSMQMANLVTIDGIGLEIFQLIDPPYETRIPALEYWKSGTFHICMTAPDFDATLQKILDLGGKQISQSWQRDPNDESKRMVYCTDPWGTVIELYTHSFVDTYK
ncbi:MAG: VOC family protein [Gammaproteobacteria bacterium]|nr:VOC family protein [Gammaproteobacteria bacterium]|tara:strand:+ start:2362 stop:2841 length:480 start_codon:yes stop_codon:yes gene_type:complete